MSLSPKGRFVERNSNTSISLKTLAREVLLVLWRRALQGGRLEARDVLVTAVKAPPLPGICAGHLRAAFVSQAS